MDDILGRIQISNAGIAKIRCELGKSESERMKHHQAEQEYVKEQKALVPCEQAARQKVEELKSLLDSIKRKRRLFKAISHAKSSNQIPGIHGRLGDLGAVEAEKYEVALSAACHGLDDNIVVETTSAANACVELLRRENLGIATFMILEKFTDVLPVWKENLRMPEGVPWLVDLVRVQDERWRFAFFAALKNTILANDLDQVAGIAYGGNLKFKVVTLDGTLFQVSGTVSGGVLEQCGGMNGQNGQSICTTAVSEEDVANANREHAVLADRLKYICQQIDAAKCRCQVSQEAVAHWELELAKSQKEIESLNSQYTNLEKQIR